MMSEHANSVEENNINNDNQPSSEELQIVRRLLQLIGNSVAACGPVRPTNSDCFANAVPEFNGTDLDEDAEVWCNKVEELTKNLTVEQRLGLATHALAGSAKKWYQRWDAKPCTWQKFREDLCAMFVSERKLHERLLRALQYTSDSATNYAEYARTKLTYLNQTRVSFSTPDLIELINSTIMDPNVRQAMINAKHTTTSDLLIGIADYKKRLMEEAKDKDKDKEKDKNRDKGRDRMHRPNMSKKRCYVCDDPNHLQNDCPKKRKAEIDRDSLKKIISCTFCSKRGHEEANCWAKQRSSRNNQNPKKFSNNTGKPEVNACYSLDHKLTPILLREKLVRCCLIDNGATCSLIKEQVAKQANCKIDPFHTTIRGLCDSTLETVGCTTTLIQTEDVSVEIDLLVVPDTAMTYDVIIGKNVLAHADLQILTDTDGTTKLRRSETQPARIDDNAKDLSCHAANLTEDDSRKDLEKLLEKYKHMIAGGNNVRCVSTGELKIRTQEDKVINYHPYRLSIVERAKVREIIIDLLNNGIIRESTSPFASPIILVKKKNGKDRLCVDYRALNKITIRDRYPLPLIDDQLDLLGHGRYFTTLDMTSGFHQIPVAVDSIEKTAFVTPDGHYEYLRMPFGLCNAPAVFQRAINVALGNLRNNIALVYLDDILIPSQSIQDGLQKLECVLEALDKAGFVLNPEKCKFFETSIDYLGREISREGIRPGKEKVKALLESPVPCNVKQVRQFMGLASYFRKFIPEFAVRTACITKLTKINEPWQWSKPQEEARQYIIDKLISKPLLTIFNPDRETELHTDASSIGYGAILFQKVKNELKVIAYFSRRTTPEESRYHSYELETLAIVNALKYFRVYLLGIKFKIITDCNAIKATQNKKNLLPRIARWWVFLQDYDFDLEYRKGKYIEHVDFFSRNPHKDYRVNVICEGSWLEIAQRNDEETNSIIKRVNNNESISSDFEVRKGILCRKICRDTGRIIYRSFIPKGSRLGLLRLYHDENCHVGYEKTYDRIAQKYWFPKMRKFVQKYIDHCITCTVCKRHTGPKQGMLHSIDKKPIPFHTIHSDCVGPFEQSKEGYQHILIIIDAFTKYVQLIPLKSLSGPETLQVFQERLTLFGLPRVVIFDRATNFTFKPLVQFIKKLGIELHYIATGAPRANGQAERYVSTVTNLLTVEVRKNTEWPSKIAKLMLTLNTTIQKSTGFSPSRLLFGIEYSVGSAVIAEEDLPDTNECFDLNHDRKIAFERLTKNTKEQNERFNKKRRDNVVYNVGNTVFIKPADTRRSKLSIKYTGPFEISKCLENDRYEIIGKTGRPQIAPKDRLRLWKGEWSCNDDIKSDSDNDVTDEPC